jgi:hypothetical protein
MKRTSKWIHLGAVLGVLTIASASALGQDALFVDQAGRVGVGTNTPSEKLSVQSTNDVKLLVENTVAETPAQAPQGKQMFELNSPGTAVIRFVIDAAGSQWAFDNDPNSGAGSGATGGAFRIAKIGTGVAEFVLDGLGNGTFAGSVTASGFNQVSARKEKQDIVPLDEAAVLKALGELDIYSWTYRRDAQGRVHFGPMADDFKTAFGLGDGNHISTVDADGVAFAAIKGLNKQVDDLKQDVQKKDAELEQLRARLAYLEQALLEGRERVGEE